MRIIVKAARYIRRTCFSRYSVRDTLLSFGSVSESDVGRQAMDALVINKLKEGQKESDVNKNVLDDTWKDYFVNENVFDDIYPQCSVEERKVLEASLESGRTWHEFRSVAVLNVEPGTTVGAFKSLLKPKHWIPKENLVLAQKDGASPLEDDSSTLDDCGIKEEDSVLLACMGGSFPLTVEYVDPQFVSEFIIPVSSCFETFGDLKKKIHEKMGKTPDDQELLYKEVFYKSTTTRTGDNIPLVLCGIARPHLKDMPEMPRISLFGENIKYMSSIDDSTRINLLICRTDGVV